MAEQIKVQAIVINKVDYKDNDRILTLFSPEKGRLTAAVRGIKKPSSKLRSSGELFVWGEYILKETKGGCIVTAFDIIEDFHALREDFSALSAGAMMLRLCDKAIEEEQPSYEAFSLLVRCLNKLNSAYSPALVISVFLFRLVSIMGYMPQTQSCAVCGTTQGLNYLSPSAGSCVCSNCRHDDAFAISGACLFFIKKITQGTTEECFVLKPTPEQEKELYSSACRYAQYFFEGKIKIAEYIKKYKLI